jgi:hypothetical protein
MYKKLLLAATIASLSGVATAASTWVTADFSAVKHTDEGIINSSEATGVAMSSHLLKIGNEYGLNDVITFTSNVAKASNVSWPSSLTSVGTGVAAMNATGLEIDATIAQNGTTLTLDLIGGNTADQAGIAVGDQFTIENDSTSTLYRVVGTAGAAGTITIIPGLAEAAADQDSVTFVQSKEMTLGYVSGTASSVSYRVTQLTGDESSTQGALIPTPEVNLSPAGLIAADQKWSMSSVSSNGTAIETLAGTQNTASSVPQYVATVGTAFNGIIDVENTRYQFTTSTTPANTNISATKKADSFVYKIQETNGVNGVGFTTTAPAALSATTRKGVLVVNGDMSFLDDDADTAGISLTQATDASHVLQAAVTTQTGTVTATTSALTVTLGSTPFGVSANGVNKSNNLDIVSTNTGAQIPVIDFAPVFTLDYDSNVASTPDKQIAFTLAGGSWKLNGASITAYGVPMGDTVSRFLWLNNAGATPGSVGAVVTSGGVRYPTTGEYQLGTSAAKKAMEVGSLLSTAMTDAGVELPSNSRANITFSVPVKESDVTLSAAYKHKLDKDRLTIETSDSTDGTDK